MADSPPNLAAHHVPVLLHEVLELLDPQPGQVIVDGTLGGGGHARAILERIGSSGQLIGLDCDANMLARARIRLEGQPVTFVHENFAYLRQVLEDRNIDSIDGVLVDLGFASDQMDDAERGLAFTRDGPLDMRLNPEEGETAGDLIARLSEFDLADLIYRYGEERFSRRIARRIVEQRKQTPIETTGQLAELVRRCVPFSRSKGRGPNIDPATRTFQALRIAVNQELEALDRFLERLPECVKVGGRAAIISFHSLEDRKVKHAFREKSLWRAVTKKPVQASEEEIQQNPRSRSAKLRCGLRIEQPL